MCGSTAQTLLFEKEGFRHVRCASCDLVFVNPRLAEHLELQRTSGTGAMGEGSLTEAQRRRLRREVDSLEPHRRLNRILEVGAGRGWFLAEAARRGWETWAVEMNKSAVLFLQRQGIDRIFVESAEKMVPGDDCVDVVRMWDVIEHLVSPSEAVANTYRALRQGGLLLVSTTNFASLSRRINGPEWVYLNGADHIYLFEPDTIKRLLLQAGFERIRIRTRSFNLRRKLYHPEVDLPPSVPLLRPFRKLIDAGVGLTGYGHQMIVSAMKLGRTPPRGGPRCISPGAVSPVD